MAKRFHSPAIDVMIDSWDDGDPFGSAMEMGWAVAVVSRAIDHPEPGQTLNFRPSPILREYSLEEIATAVDRDSGNDDDVSLTMADLATAVQAGHVTEDDLSFAARVLHRYIGLCERAGRSY